MDLRLSLICGTDIPVPECQLIIRQPLIKDIALIGENEFFTGVQTLCIDKKMISLQDETLLRDTNNFQIFMTVISEEEAKDKKKAVQSILPLFFPSSKVMFTPRSIIFKDENNSIIVDETNFEYLQKAISSICCLKTGLNAQNDFNPADKKAKEIAEKIMRGRKIIAEQKGEANSSIFTQYVSVLTVALNSMSLKDVINLTIFQLNDLIERYTLYMNWDLDIRSRLAGGTSEKKPDNWMKNIH